MLLPSALGCDSSSQMPKTRFQSAPFASPPLSPPPSSRPNINNIYSTCRALQSMLSPPNHLPSPPTTHADAPSSPMKLRLRERKRAEESTPSLTSRRKITKRAAPPPRGINKRTRATDDEMSRDDVEDGDSEQEEHIEKPSTPKRMRFAPEIIPLGLARSDFHDLRLADVEKQGSETVFPSVEGSSSSGDWSTDDDRLLVELVLEKLKLTKSEWQDCARSLGKDRGSVGRRWKSLMGAGDVGLKSRPRRAKIHGTWR
ncbi:uncharacterized protein RAG0_01932 [Rhynchosporium agropyri]|uniref:Myb-like domain-containing protein n=1 Tax=Rhynchosporium agropyri TaxID=914238 RepID=A0A1E1JZ89_9HELO|nr:uncharacterized protein RAG0_01932 [Rhynchosporium agropyri]